SAWIRRERPVDAAIFSTANYKLPESSQDYGSGIEIRTTKSGQIEVRLNHRWPAYSVNIRTRQCALLEGWQHIMIVSDGTSVARGLQVILNGEPCFQDVIHDDLNGGAGGGGTVHIGGSDEKGADQFIGGIAGVSLFSTSVGSKELASVGRWEALKQAAKTP